MYWEIDKAKRWRTCRKLASDGVCIIYVNRVLCYVLCYYKFALTEKFICFKDKSMGYGKGKTCTIIDKSPLFYKIWFYFFKDTWL